MWDMMIKLSLVLLIYLTNPSLSQRRLVGGKVTLDKKPYMVYLVKAKQSPKEYTGWLCGGCIVHPDYILTAASCVFDVLHMYAIAGYSTYVSSEDISRDECTQRYKKKIVHVCTDGRYNPHNEDFLSHDVWAWAEIAFARVESPYDFTDKSYLKYCSYTPKAIVMNFEAPILDTEGIALGWGHSKYYRPDGDTKDYNVPSLRYISLRSIRSKQCIEMYGGAIENLLRSYAFCMASSNVLDSFGNMVEQTELKNGCEPDLTTQEDDYYSRKGYENNTLYYYDSRRMFLKNSYLNTTSNRTNKNSLCQNDHGGPLIVWRGGRETVVGIATIFMVTKSMRCVGPSVFLSLKCVGGFVKCLLPQLAAVILESSKTKNKLRCGKEDTRIYERNITWID